MNASSADTSMIDCVRNAQHGVKSVSCANQRIILPASAENHREGEHNIMFTNYKMTDTEDEILTVEHCNSEVEDIRSVDFSGLERAFSNRHWRHLQCHLKS